MAYVPFKVKVNIYFLRFIYEAGLYRLMLTDRERFSILLGVNMAIMEMMYTMGVYKGGQQPKREFMQERLTEILSEICTEQCLKIDVVDFQELVPECYRAINLSNDMTDRLLRK